MALDGPGPLCLVLMPFGTKRDANGETIDFDRIYGEILRPAVEDAGLQCIRADEEHVGGIIHKPMFERLLLCEFAIADLTTANAHVYYELGIRHAVRPRTTALVFADGFRLPFDLGPLRGLTYHLDASGNPARPADDRVAFADWLRAARASADDEVVDSPVFALIDWLRPPDISHSPTATFRDEVDYAAGRREQLRVARQRGVEAVDAVRDELGDLRHAEVGVVVDVLLSYRSVGATDQMVELVEQRIGPAVSRMTIVREQYAFALNRIGRREDAIHVLEALIAERGPSSETYGILGRVRKDQWQDVLAGGQRLAARRLLDRAIEAYLTGFEADWRDPYPGFNAVELMELRTPPDPRRHDLLPVVRYAAERRMAGTVDYWDLATMLEIAVLEDDADRAETALAHALAAGPEPWQLTTTRASLRRIREHREAQGEDQAWLLAIEEELGADG